MCPANSIHMGLLAGSLAFVTGIHWRLRWSGSCGSCRGAQLVPVSTASSGEETVEFLTAALVNQGAVLKQWQCKKRRTLRYKRLRLRWLRPSNFLSIHVNTFLWIHHPNFDRKWCCTLHLSPAPRFGSQWHQWGLLCQKNWCLGRLGPYQIRNLHLWSWDILRSLASSGQKFLSLDKLKLTSLNSWKLPERLLPSCRRSAMVHGSICLNPHFPATRSPRSRYAIATSRPSCRARTKQNRLRAKRHAQPMAPMAPTGLQRPQAAPGSAGRRFQRFQYQLVSACRMEKDGFLEVSNRVSTELPLWCTTS